jgi:hypothetical protein
MASHVGKVLMEKGQVSTDRLRKLLFELRDTGSPACFRCRLLGKMWDAGFGRVVNVSGDALTLYDESKTNFLTIPDIKMIMQFELDQSFQDFEPHFHYGLTDS